MEITTFKWVPPFIQGWVSDIRLRWALEEIGQAYTLQLIGFDGLHTEAYRKRQPFEQVPVLRDGDLELFETGSIVLHIAEKFSASSEVLLPAELAGRARARSWIFAAVDSVQPSVHNFIAVEDSEEPSEKARRAAVLEPLRIRLTRLERWMSGRTYLEDHGFSAGDLMMTAVLRNLIASGVLEEFPRVNAHMKRCMDRPAFKKALADQMKTFAENAPKT